MHQEGSSILDHQDYQPNGSHFYIYDDAIIDSSTASYLEAEIILNTIQALHIDGGKNSFNIMFIVGDQQLYDRICVLVNRCPELFSLVVPIAGFSLHWSCSIMFQQTQVFCPLLQQL